MTFDAYTADFHVLLKDGNHRTEYEVALGKDYITVELELYLLGDLDLVLLDARRRAPVGLGVVGSLARNVRTRVLGIDDAVLVAIRGTAIGLGVVGLDAWYFRTRVLG